MGNALRQSPSLPKADWSKRHDHASSGHLLLRMAHRQTEHKKSNARARARFKALHGDLLNCEQLALCRKQIDP